MSRNNITPLPEGWKKEGGGKAEGVPFSRSAYRLIVGVDPGVSTGLAMWDRLEKRFVFIKTCSLIEAFVTLGEMVSSWPEMFVRVEDARQVRFGTDSVKAQGAGSVKRDCKLWAEYLKKCGIDHEFVRPNKRITKLDAAAFERVTGWKERTSSHARDSAMLIFKF